MYQVFVSSTYDDLKQERNEVIKALLELSCFPVGMENFSAADDTQWVYIQRLIKECDYYIVIIGSKYGSELEDGMSYTEREYRFAIENRIPVIAFTHSDINKILKGEAKLKPETLKKFIKFIELVRKKLCKPWRDKYELGAVVSRSITNLMTDKPGTGWIRGDEETEEHKKLAINYSDVIRKYDELKLDSVIAPKYYDNYDLILPSLNTIFDKLINDEVSQTEPIKIRLLGVCFHKSFSFIKEFIEKNCGIDKKIEIRLSGLDRNSEILDVLNNVWPSHFDVYEKQLDELIKRIEAKDNTNITLKISKYDHMPNWHGMLINKKHLFLSACVWSSDQSMTAGENHYTYYKKNTSTLHNQKILQFKRWFDYGRFYGTVKIEDQLIFEPSNI